MATGKGRHLHNVPYLFQISLAGEHIFLNISTANYFSVKRNDLLIAHLRFSSSFIFIYSEKAMTNDENDEISKLFLTLQLILNKIRRFLQNVVAFSEYINFNVNT